AGVTAEVVKAPALDNVAEALMQVFSRSLIEEGLLEYDPQGQPKVGLFDRSVLVENPLHGRLIDRNLEELAESLDQSGQQEPIVARVVTDADRRRWPEVIRDEHRLFILDGRRIFRAQPLCRNVKKLRVEVVLPKSGESPEAYHRRTFLRASITMMQS